jgi:hypothetical protein
MSARVRWLWVAGLGLALTIMGAAAPAALRHVDAFRVRAVEVHGTRYLEPDAVVSASGVSRESSLFDDPTAWHDALLAHPLIAEVRIARRAPRTLIIHVTESEPVALARTPELRPVDARGRLLPITTGLAELDVPVLGRAPKVADDVVIDDATRFTLAGLARLRALQPELWGWVSEAYAGTSHMRLVLRGPARAEMLVALPVEADRLRDVRAVLGDLAASDPGALDRLARIDARFHDQVLVSLHNATARGREVR